jgi:putative nucleotidyltransferase with HDIG domain
MRYRQSADLRLPIADWRIRTFKEPIIILMTDEVLKLWPELMWIENAGLREQTAKTWELALEKSVLKAEDLQKIPFTLLAGPDLKVSFMAHKRCVVHVAREAAIKMNEFFGNDLPVNMDVLIAGAILADVGKLLEYELDKDGKSFQGKYGKYLRHPFSGVSLAEQCGVPAEVCHIIAAHAGEGDMIKRTVEAYIVHHADFMTFEPFRERLK